MFAKIRTGIVLTILLATIATLVFWRPISRRITDYTFEKTTERVAAALPAGERGDAEALTRELWSAIQTHGIPTEHKESFQEFQSGAWDMLKNQEVTEEEARAFLARVRELLETVYR